VGPQQGVDAVGGRARGVEQDVHRQPVEERPQPLGLALEVAARVEAATLGQGGEALVAELLTAVTGDVQRAQALLTYLVTVTLILVIWFLTGPVPAMAAARRLPSDVGARGERD
jgi:hypothetical protein